MPSQVHTIIDDAHDAIERTDGSGFDATQTTLNLTNSSLDLAGLLFDPPSGWQMKQGAEITSATLRLYTTSGGQRNDPFMDIYAETIDDAPDFTSNADVDQRHALRASTAKVTNWDNGVDQSIGYTTDIPDLKTVIQEIIDRSGWAIGNALCLLLDQATGGGTNYEFNSAGHASAATQGPELTIVWAGNAKRSFAKVMA